MKGCDGVIVLITPHLKNASGALWEIECAKKLNKQLLGIYIGGATNADSPAELFGVSKINWTWFGIADFVNKLP